MLAVMLLGPGSHTHQVHLTVPVLMSSSSCAQSLRQSDSLMIPQAQGVRPC